MRIAVIGGSAGALEVLRYLVPALPEGFAVPIAVVIHVPAGQPSYLAEVLGNDCRVAVKEAEDKEPLAAGTVHVAPPGYHLLVEREGTLALSVDEPVRWSRPAIDVLFESAADAFGRDAVGIVLSGASEDGARGLARIIGGGGVGAVQCPELASIRTMPEAALRRSPSARVLAPDELAPFLISTAEATAVLRAEAP
jgi:two-component system, chemotaxis family, protein-glutamate methylesterase/glutaminase